MRLYICIALVELGSAGRELDYVYDLSLFFFLKDTLSYFYYQNSKFHSCTYVRSGDIGFFCFTSFILFSRLWAEIDILIFQRNLCKIMSIFLLEGYETLYTLFFFFGARDRWKPSHAVSVIRIADFIAATCMWGLETLVSLKKNLVLN